jgi:ParB-like chromosome segregation protein Spo0J
MADQIRATPRSPILGLFSDLVNLPLQYMSSPERTQQSQGAAQFLYGTGIPKTLERISYGDSLFSGSGGLGGTTRIRPETAEALMTVAPFAPVAGRVAGRMIKATEGMPVGMGIKDVGKGIFEDATKYHQKVPEIKTINVNNLKRMNSGEVSDVSDEVAAKMDFSKPIQVSVFSDGELRIVDGHHRVAAAKKLGIQSLPVELQAINAKGATLNKLAQEATYPQQAALTVKPPTDDIYEVMDATFNYGKSGGNKTIPIDQLTGGVRMSDPTEARRVKELADKISSPEGYISRIIVDDSGNVLEGQHRLEALRLLGEKNVPVSVIEDLSNKYDISAMENAIQGKFRSDQSTQLVRQAIDTLEEAGSVEKALSDYSMPPMFQQPFQDAIRASQKVKPTPIESPAYSDPFGNTIGSSIR